jgi:hypothetical protein
MRRVASLIAAVALVASAAVLATGPSGAQDGDSDIYVVHGIPGLPVDVYVNDALTLPDFQPEAVEGPLALPAATYNVKVYAAEMDPPADAADRLDSPAIEDDLAVPAGINASVVAHYNAADVPVLSVFVNDVSPVAAGEARVTARHTALAPEVNVLADGAVVFADVANGDEGVADVPAGSYDLAVEVAPDGPEVLALDGVELVEGVNTIAYVIGRAEQDSLTVVVQTIEVGVTEPEAPVEPTPPVPPTPAPPAEPVHGQPTFTG